MSKDSSNSSERPEIPHFYSSLKRMCVILQEETATLEKVVESKQCQTTDLEPFSHFIREALKEIKIGEKILKIAMRNLEEDMRFWGEEETKKTECKIEEKENRR